MTIVNARLLADTIYCEETEFSYTSRAPNITVPFAVIWGGSKPLDNPHNIHLVIYRCRDMADNCGMCLTLAPKYDCGWCQSTDRCEVKDNCERNIGMWLNSNQTCPNPEIHSFEPVMGPWEGNTNVTIRGINLGQTFKVRINKNTCPFNEIFEEEKFFLYMYCSCKYREIFVVEYICRRRKKENVNINFRIFIAA